MRHLTLSSVVLSVALAHAGCSSESGGDTPADTSVDIAADGAGDTSDDGDGEAGCNDGETFCSDDALELHRCVDGAWEITACMTEAGQLCENGGCVDPWAFGSPEWATCPDHPRDAGPTLAAKAAAYDDLAARLHIHPDLGWAMDVFLRTREVDCPEGVEEPCTEPAVSLDEATWEDVDRWRSVENDGLWNGLYITSQAFRYAVTESADALDNLRVLMRAEERRMAITGVPGVFTRQMAPPDMASLPCPADPLAYAPDVEKDDNKWVRIGDDGCAQYYDTDTEAFVSTDHCGLGDFAGWCWLDNVSQDEYAGHMMALAAVWRLVDDEEIRAITLRLLDQIGTHLLDNELTFVDWDGRITEHGLLYAMSLVDSPGFLAAQALAWVRLSADATGREDLQEFYDDCLLQRSAEGRCMSWALETGTSYLEHLPTMILYVGDDGCSTNFNRLAMVFANLWVLLEYEHDAELRTAIQEVLRDEVFEDDSSRAISKQGNPWYNFMYAASKTLGPDSDGPAADAVEEGICALREFPTDQVRRTHDLSAYPYHCDARLGSPASEHPMNLVDRCPYPFIWWRSPYDLRECRDDPSYVALPGDYLLAYWMGRYYGFIGPDL